MRFILKPETSVFFLSVILLLGSVSPFMVNFMPSAHAEPFDPTPIEIHQPSPALTEIQFGHSVAVNGDTIVVGSGAFGQNTPNPGVAYMYDSSGNSLFSLTDPTPGFDELFGHDVAIDSTGVVTGAHLDAETIGSVYSYDLTGIPITTINDPTPNTLVNHDSFGHTLAKDGNLVLIGSPNADITISDSGEVHLFDLTDNSLLQTYSFPSTNLFGHALDIDGTDIVISAFNHGPGKVYVFSTLSSDSPLIISNPNGESNNDWFGAGVSVDAGRVVIGASGSASASMFDTSDGSLLTTFVNPNGSDGFGRTVSLVGDKVLIGAYLNDSSAPNSGIAYLFDANTGNLLQTFQNPSPADNDLFGWDAAMSENLIVIGSRGDDTDGINSGLAYVYSLSTIPDDPSPDDGTGPPSTPGGGNGNSDPPANPGPPAETPGKGQPPANPGPSVGKGKP